MFSHPPSNYVCPICLGNQGVENEQTLLKQTDLIFRDDLVSVWLNSFWIAGNEGHVIVVPNKHYETLYDLPSKVRDRIFEVGQKMSLVLKKAYQCDGITLRQNNEPAGDQHAFHFHLHIFPRYTNDSFNLGMTQKSHLSDPEERYDYGQKLQKMLREDWHD
jgi:histidine triad (HIT) family protein